MGYESMIQGEVRVNDVDEFIEWLNHYQHTYDDGSVWYGFDEYRYSVWLVNPFQDGIENHIDKGVDGEKSIISFNTDYHTHYGFDGECGDDKKSFLYHLSKHLKDDEVGSFIEYGENEHRGFYFVGKDRVESYYHPYGFDLDVDEMSEVKDVSRLMDEVKDYDYIHNLYFNEGFNLPIVDGGNEIPDGETPYSILVKCFEESKRVYKDYDSEYLYLHFAIDGNDDGDNEMVLYLYNDRIKYFVFNHPDYPKWYVEKMDR